LTFLHSHHLARVPCALRAVELVRSAKPASAQTSQIKKGHHEMLTQSRTEHSVLENLLYSVNRPYRTDLPNSHCEQTIEKRHIWRAVSKRGNVEVVVAQSFGARR